MPTLAQQAASTELQTLTTSLRAATASYSKTVLELLEAGTTARAAAHPTDGDAYQRIGGSNRVDVAQWATGATAEFRKRNEAIGVIVSARSWAVQQECASARQAIGEAAKTVQREAEALGLKQKH